MEKRKCPFCKSENAGGLHIYKCVRRNYELTKDEIKFEFYKFNFPEICNYDNLYKDYVVDKLGLPALQTKYNIDFKSIQWLLKYFKIEKRTITESALLGAERTRKSLFKNFGVINVGQLDTIKEKKKQTCIKKYGVDNVRKTKEFRIKLEQHIQEKYRISVNELRRKQGKEYWEKISDEQRYSWLKKSIWSNRGYKSSLETKIEEIIKQLNITYTIQFPIKRKYYDFLINEYNLIIEVNGDYWHANPQKYKETDLIKYPYGTYTAKDIWEKDKNKRKLAEDKGYTIIYIWEKEIYETKDLAKLLLEKIHENIKD